MSVNKYLPHVLVLPEDEADEDLARGFWLSKEFKDCRQFQVLSFARGWIKVVDCFLADHARDMERFPMRQIILLLDFDDDESRIDDVKERIPDNLADRVFVLGALSDPEKLKSAMSGRSLESIGQQIARDCREGTDATWSDQLLRHNLAEVARMNNTVRPVLFPAD
jgi:hypothetical protein